MKKILLVAIALVAFTGLAAKAQTIFNDYAYLSSGATPGVSTTWYNLNGSAQSHAFQGANLGSFNTNFWLGGQSGFWSNGSGVNFITLHYSITGTKSASGSVSYSFQNYSAPNDQWGTDVNGSHLTDSSINLISTNSLTNGSYSIALWVEGKANNGVTVWDSNGGSNYNASFSVVPEPSTFALISLSAMGAGVLLRRRKV